MRLSIQIPDSDIREARAIIYDLGGAASGLTISKILRDGLHSFIQSYAQTVNSGRRLTGEGGKWGHELERLILDGKKGQKEGR
jgi:hypothetical protein